VLSLTIHTPGEPVRRFQVNRPALTLGRSSANDVFLVDRTLSRVHARLDQRPEGLVLTDLGSRNGTQLNGTRIIDPVPVRAGDRIVLGETTIEVTEENLSGTRVVIDAGGDRLEKTMISTTNAVASLRRTPAREVQDAAELTRLATSLQILNEVSLALLKDIPLVEMSNLILEKLFAYLEPDRGLLMLRDGSGELKPEALKFADGIDPADIRLSRTLVETVTEGRHGVLMIDTATDVKIGIADSIRLQGVTSCLAAPLFVDDEVIGLVYLEARLGRKSFTEEDLRLLTSLANTAAIKIQNLRLQETAAAKVRIEREMALAWDVQRRLFPDEAPELPSSELFGRTLPSRTVSGDYYDFFVRGDGTVDVVVADVCGKGMAASILAASVQSAFQAWAAENLPPDRLCARLNDLVYRRTSPEKFVTFFMALYDPETGSILYANAGHNPGVVLRTDGSHELLPAHGPPLGLFPGQAYGSGAFTLSPGDLLLLYTDGVTEAANADDKEFGLDRLVELTRSVASRPLAEMEGAIGEGLAEFAAGVAFHDDRTVVLLRRL
jgi:serine phosphatase RsbU (regulator of sigma subunit)/pSer/pThr/pTyr-binding forkhead associated (FHA) protein